MKEAGRSAAYVRIDFNVFFDVCPLMRDDRRMVLTQNKACKQSRVSMNIHSRYEHA